MDPLAHPGVEVSSPDGVGNGPKGEARAGDPIMDSF